MKRILLAFLALLMLTVFSSCRKEPPIVLYLESYTAAPEEAEISFDHFVDYGSSEVREEDVTAVSKDESIAFIDGSVIKITGKIGKTDIVFTASRRKNAVLHISTADHPES